jgi:hypothetical protein
MQEMEYTVSATNLLNTKTLNDDSFIKQDLERLNIWYSQDM